ncbi:hypothetical protein NPIL_472981 [Nephila pilipes]|uniref:Uncharacterized protein n=1 Tax=Nephila pilipes TaxID=299642 RepID=A0A8X6USB6_NEPPI|nr:hypothetical protein NPIL_472981 [Nephila pilipes]
MEITTITSSQQHRKQAVLRGSSEGWFRVEASWSRGWCWRNRQLEDMEVELPGSSSWSKWFRRPMGGGAGLGGGAGGEQGAATTTAAAGTVNSGELWRRNTGWRRSASAGAGAEQTLEGYGGTASAGGAAAAGTGVLEAQEKAGLEWRSSASLWSRN